MKNKITILLMTVIAVFTTTLVKAQCPTIKNDMACNIVVQYQVIDCSSNICTSGTSFAVPAFQALTIPCTGGTCPPHCNIVVTLTSVAGSPVGGPSANYGTSFPGNGFSTPISCGVSSAAIWYDGPNREFKVK